MVGACLARCLFTSQLRAAPEPATAGGALFGVESERAGWEAVLPAEEAQLAAWPSPAWPGAEQQDAAEPSLLRCLDLQSCYGRQLCLSLAQTSDCWVSCPEQAACGWEIFTAPS